MAIEAARRKRRYYEQGMTPKMYVDHNVTLFRGIMQSQTIRLSFYCHIGSFHRMRLTSEVTIRVQEVVPDTKSSDVSAVYAILPMALRKYLAGH